MILSFTTGPLNGRTVSFNVDGPIVLGRHGDLQLPDTRASRRMPASSAATISG